MEYNLLYKKNLSFAAAPSQKNSKLYNNQHANKVVSDSLGLVDFAIGLVNSIFNLPNGRVMFFKEFE